MKKILQIINKRWRRAADAFHEHQGRAELDQLEHQPQVMAPVLGWVYFNEGTKGPLMLKKGKNIVVESEDSLITELIESSDVLTSHLQVKNGSLCVFENGNTRLVHHGESFEYQGHQMKFNHLSSPKILRFYQQKGLISLFVFTAVSSLLVNFFSPSLQAKDIFVVNDGRAKVSFNESKKMKFNLPGVYSLKAKELAGSLISDNQSYPLRVSEAELTKKEYFIAVDTSSLCSVRDMNGVMIDEVRSFLNAIPEDSIVSLMQYFRKEDGIEVYEKINKRVKAKALRSQNHLFQCSKSYQSLNAFGALDQFYQEVKKSDAEDKVMLLITSGNVRELPRVIKKYKKLNLQISAFVYSPFMNDYLNNALGQLVSKEGVLEHWPNKKSVKFKDKVKMEWDLTVDFSLPVNLEKKEYPIELVYKAGESKYILSSKVDHVEDQKGLIWARVKLFFIIVLLLSVLGYLIYRVRRYYQDNICETSGQVMSRSWNESVFSAKGESPIVVIQHPYEQTRTVVLSDLETSFGKSFHHAVRLPLALSRASFIIERKGSFIYQLCPGNNSSYIHNGVAVNQVKNLGTGDQIQVDSYTIKFFSSQQEVLNEAGL